MKKGRHRRFEEARALKRSDNVDLDGIFESLDDNGSSGVSDWEDVADEYSQWADVAAEYEAKQATDSEPASAEDGAASSDASDGADDDSDSEPGNESEAADAPSDTDVPKAESA